MSLHTSSVSSFSVLLGIYLDGIYLHDVTEIVLLVSIPSNILLVDWYSLVHYYYISYLILFPFPSFLFIFIKFVKYTVFIR